MIADHRDGARLGLAVANNTDLPRTYELKYVSECVLYTGQAI